MRVRYAMEKRMASVSKLRKMARLTMAYGTMVLRRVLAVILLAMEIVTWASSMMTSLTVMARKISKFQATSTKAIGLMEKALAKAS